MNISRRDRARLNSWQDKKATILLRDRNRCVYCRFQGGLDGENLTIDHVVPLSAGGDSKPKNLAACCHSCNHLKGNQVPRGLSVIRMKNGRLLASEYERIYQQLIEPNLCRMAVGR